MADEADLSVVLALLQAAFVWKCDDHGLDPRGWPLSCRPEIVVRAVITFLPAWTSSAGVLLTPADFPFFNGCAAASTSLRRMGYSYSVSVWGQFSTDGSPLAL